MSLRVALHHKTAYQYERAVRLSPQIIRLRPAPHCRTRILSYSLKLEPRDHFINWQQDPAGNYQARIVIPEPTRRFSFTVDLVAELAVYNPFDFFVEESAERYPFEYEPQLRKELRPYLEAIEPGPLLRDWIETARRELARGEPLIIDFIVALNQKLARDIKYLIRMEPGVQDPEETLEKASGSCRDSAWLLVQILRHLGLAARFVSGYLIQLKADQAPVEADAPKGPSEDFTDLHAWSEVYLPGAGWVGLDSTSGLVAAEGHLPLAATAEPQSAAPVVGASEPVRTDFHFEMSVQRLDHQPGSARPYTDETWHRIEGLARRVESDLNALKIRLTMGGEPTFVYAPEPDAPEWNLKPDGGKKRSLGAELLYKMRAQFAPGGLLYHGQGKWYPGEPLPRWALACIFRSDGEPLWMNDALLAREVPTQDAEVAQPNNPAPAASDARRLLETIARNLGAPAETILAAREDLYHEMWQRGDFYAARPRSAASGGEAEDAEAVRQEQRGILESVMRADLEGALAKKKPIGYVLPLRRHPGQERWLTARWPAEADPENPAGALFLIPGDSALGYRLPLNRLPEERLPGYEFLPERSPLEPLPPFEDARARIRERSEAARAANGAGVSEIDPGIMFRQALCTEIRDGGLRVFFPPCSTAEDYIELVAATELAAEECGLAVFLEGYEPPIDARMQRFAITPDPGVLEVNVQPAKNWEELERIVFPLYETARQMHLTAEKFMLDGRAMGSGGGNHITLGGVTPSESPFLRRPGLLRSMIAYWQHHPSLSYLFSGLFVGPTSQAPRVDEARHESLYELEIAFANLPEGDGERLEQPWLADRLLRNLLVDMTGNTHRAEFCIDKLYPAESLSRRLGLIELRAFEMPPHPRMYMTCMLLLRALVARFWREPYQHGRPRLVRWGVDLTDRFMLPYFLWKDFRQVLDELGRCGYEFTADMFEPFFAFRFPVYGETVVDGVELELRMALEPWPVLGEIDTGGGVSRPVDAAVERVQILARGITPDRHVLVCNGHRVPLAPTGVRGEGVAGVRYKAWNPPNTMHPGIPAHTPLVFDLVDAWQKRSLGGCTYHVSHPGGRAYETAPVNAAEAESRRESRFFRQGHTPGPLEPPPALEHPEYPMTLDLRLQAPGSD